MDTYKKPTKIRMLHNILRNIYRTFYLYQRCKWEITNLWLSLTYKIGKSSRSFNNLPLISFDALPIF